MKYIGLWGDKMNVKGISPFIGEIRIPGDKSISHRAVILASISDKSITIENILKSEDINRTIEIFREMGVNFIEGENGLLVEGCGLKGLKEPKRDLYCGNSGTTMRLMAGLLAGQNFDSVLTGDDSLTRRPMARVIEPLSLMGARIESETNKPPLRIKGGRKLNDISYDMPVASGQVKSSILLASLYANSRSKIKEPSPTRDHTEIMLKHFRDKPSVDRIFVPGDISSASFFIVGASIIEGSSIILRDIGVNPTRMGLVEALVKMGANIKISNKKLINGEPVADIEVVSSQLKAISIRGNQIASMIDEIPIFAVAGAFAQGQTLVENAEELRYKETDRIRDLVVELKKANIDIVEKEDGFIINGNRKKYIPAQFNSYGDHRLAMTFAILARAIEGQSRILNEACVNISYPNFFENLN